MSGCQLLCNPDGSVNGFGTFLVWVGVVIVVGGVALALIAWVVTGVREAFGRSPGRGPAPAGSPAARGTYRGYRHLTYSAPVSAVTPGGVRVRHARCCQSGHRCPEDAAAHAVAVGDRIARFGR